MPAEQCAGYLKTLNTITAESCPQRKISRPNEILWLQVIAFRVYTVKILYKYTDCGYNHDSHPHYWSASFAHPATTLCQSLPHCWSLSENRHSPRHPWPRANEPIFCVCRQQWATP